MPLRRIISLLGLTLYFGATLTAQDVSPRDPQAVVIVQQSVAALGGANLTAIRDTQSSVQGTTLRANGRVSFSGTFKTLGIRNFRLEFTGPDGLVVLVFGDKGAWSKSGGTDAQPVPRMMVANGGITHIPLLSVLAEWKEADRGLEYIGLENLGGEDVHHIRLQRPRPLNTTAAEKAPPCDLFISARTMLLVRLIYPMHSPSNIRMSEPVTIDYGDYRVVSGLAVPFSVTQTMRGQVIKEFRVTSFAVNQGIALSEFELR